MVYQHRNPFGSYVSDALEKVTHSKCNRVLELFKENKPS